MRPRPSSLENPEEIQRILSKKRAMEIGEYIKRANSLLPHFPQVATAISAPTAWRGSRVLEGLWGDAEEGEELTL